MPEISTDALQNPQCGPEDDAYTPVANLVYCFHYLRNLGTTPCAFKRNQVTTLCRFGGDGIVIGVGLVQENQSSYWYVKPMS
ncbi:hypothetical protein ACJQWK_09006 [Exserohilum turcicum]